ncbi:arsenate reductase/protein-tyrosine-phosphatase family protein [Geoglobus sp.]
MLFVSRRNSCRTKLAEAIFNKVAPHNMRALSAGLHPESELNPLAEWIAEKKTSNSPVR